MRTFITITLYLTSQFALSSCNSFFQVLNQPQDSSLLPGQKLSRAELYGASSISLGSSQGGALKPRKNRTRRLRKRKKQATTKLPPIDNSVVKPFDLGGNDGPPSFSFPILNSGQGSRSASSLDQSFNNIAPKSNHAQKLNGRDPAPSADDFASQMMQDDGAKMQVVIDEKRSYKSGINHAQSLSKARKSSVMKGRSMTDDKEENAILDLPEESTTPGSGGNDTSGGEGAESAESGGSVPFLDFVENGSGPGESGAVGLPPNFTMEEYDQYCNAEDNERRKRICPWNVESNITSDEDNAKEKPLDMDNLFEEAERMSVDKIIAGQIHLIAMQNRKIMIETIKRAIFPAPEFVEETEPLVGVKLLNITRRIFTKICPPNVVSNKFLTMVFNGFKLLHDITTPARTPFISDFEYEMLEPILETCLSESKPANYIQNQCKEDVVAVNSTKEVLCLGFMRTEGVNHSTACYQTNYHVYDPILDIAWLMFEAVKANCFEHFQGNDRLLHRFSVAVMDMFTRPMKSRWPLQRESKDYWERLLGPGLELSLNNIDKCVHHIVDKSTFDFRTPRYFNINSVRLSNTHTQFLQR